MLPWKICQAHPAKTMIKRILYMVSISTSSSVSSWFLYITFMNTTELMLNDKTWHCFIKNSQKCVKNRQKKLKIVETASKKNVLSFCVEIWAILYCLPKKHSKKHQKHHENADSVQKCKKFTKFEKYAQNVQKSRKSLHNCFIGNLKSGVAQQRELSAQDRSSVAIKSCICVVRGLIFKVWNWIFYYISRLSLYSRYIKKPKWRFSKAT